MKHTIWAWGSGLLAVSCRLLALGASGTAAAQDYCHVRTFNMNDGLPSNNIAGIDQSRDGMMWIATWNGLCSYDGYRFTTFRQLADGDELSTQRIAMIKADSQGHLWTKTYDGGLYLLDMGTGRFIDVGREIERRYGQRPAPRNIYALDNGYTWITDETGRMNLRVNDRQATCMDSIEVYGNTKPLFGRYIKKVEMDRQGREWIITDRGMALYGSNYTRTGTFEQLTPPTAKSQKPIANNQQQALIAQAAPQLAAATEKTFRDRQGNIWFTTQYGLSLACFSDEPVSYWPVADGQAVRSVLCKKDGTVWAGTYDGSIRVFRNDGQPAGWLNSRGQVVSGSTRFSHHLYALFEDSRGWVWIGTKGDGIYVIRGSEVSHYLPDATDRFALNHADIYHFDEDRWGHIWIATFGGGVNIYMPERAQFIHRGNELKGYPEGFAKVRRITHDRQGTMLIASTSGLLTGRPNGQDGVAKTRFYKTNRRQGEPTSLRTDDVMQTLVTRSGRVYVATQGGNVQMLTSASLLQDQLQFQPVDALNHTTADALSLIEDVQGDIWVVRTTGVERYRPATGEVSPFQAPHSHNDVELTEALPTADGAGHLWMAALGGVLTFDIHHMHKSQYVPPLVFTHVVFQGEQTTHPILNRQRLEISSDHRSLTIGFAALDYSGHELIQYAYQMDEESTWNHIGFSQLAPGIHTLAIKSTNSDGVWTDNVVRLQLDVKPLLWERTWVRILALITVIALMTAIILTYMRHRQHTKERERRLENILRQYRELQEQVSHGQVAHEYRLEEPKIKDADEEMMERLMAFIEQHIGDEEMKIEDMADAVGLGRTVFYGKIKSLVGVSPSDFLRQVRMKRAEQLVAHSKMTFAEIAYSIGFTDPKYFSKCFKKETGMTPSEYRTQKVEN